MNVVATSNRISVSEMKNTLSEVLNRAAYGKERIVIASRGRPKAAVISIEDLELLEELEDALAAHRGLADYEAGQTLAWEEVRAGLVAEEVR